MEGEFTRLPIDELPDEPIQEIIPLTHQEVSSFLTNYKKFVDVFESWSRIHLWFLHEWVVTTTSKPFNFLDWLKEDAVVMTRNEIIEKFKTIHHTQDDKPVVNFTRYYYFEIDKDDWGDRVLLTGTFKDTSGELRTLADVLLIWPKGIKGASTIEAQPFYEGVRNRLSEYLNRIVNGLRRHFELKYEGNTEVFERGTIEPADKTEWFQRVVQELYVIEMGFKVLGSLWKCCEEVFNVLQDSSNGQDSCFEGENARVLQSRIAFLMTLTVPVIKLVDLWKIKQREDLKEYYQESFNLFGAEDCLPVSRDQDDQDGDQMVEIPVKLPRSMRGNCPGYLVYKLKFIGFNVHSSGHLYWKLNLAECSRTKYACFSIKNTYEPRAFMDIDFFQRKIQKTDGLYSITPP